MRTRKRKLLHISLIALSIVFSFSVLELTARVYQHLRGRTFEDSLYGHVFRDSFYLGPTFKPNAISDWQSIKNMTVSRYGFRSIEFEIEKSADMFRIVTLGGSTSHSGEYPKKLETILQKQEWNSKGTLQVINAATPTWNSTQSLIQFITRVLYLKPDMLIVYHGINDTPNTKYRWLTDLPMVDYEEYAGILRRYSLAYNFLLPRVRKAYRSYRGRNWLKEVSGDKTLLTKSITIKDPEGEYKNFSPQIFHMNMQNLIFLTKAHGIELVLVTMPLRHNEEKSDMENIQAAGRYYTKTGLSGYLTGVSSHNHQLRQLAKQHNVLLVDAANSTINGKYDFFSDLCHFNEKGALELAKVIANGITPVINSQWKQDNS